MAKRKASYELPAFKSVIQLPLNPEMVDSVITLIATPKDILEALLELPQEGLIVTLSPNPQGGASCSIRNANPSSGNAGLMFFSNAPTPLEAIAVALVKLDFLEKSKDWETVGGKGFGTGYR